MLPPDIDVETKAVLRQLARANRALAELKGYAESIPNKHILINAIMINEAKDSSAIENIITTHDELFKAMSSDSVTNPNAKEVINYRTALWRGYDLVKLINTNEVDLLYFLPD
jgi:Fic family protein